MPAATSKFDLLKITATEFTKLMTLVEGCPYGLTKLADEDGITPKDIIGHRAHWIALTLGWYQDGMAGKPGQLPAPGYKWSDLKRYNSELREAQKIYGWADVVAMLEAHHASLIETIEGLDDAGLYGAPMKGGNGKWPPGRFFEAAGASHYRSASKYLRARIKAFDPK